MWTPESWGGESCIMGMTLVTGGSVRIELEARSHMTAGQWENQENKRFISAAAETFFYKDTSVWIHDKNFIPTRISPSWSFHVCFSHSRYTSFNIVFKMYHRICWHYSENLHWQRPPCTSWLSFPPWVDALLLLQSKQPLAQFQQQLDFLFALWSASVIPECKVQMEQMTSLFQKCQQMNKRFDQPTMKYQQQ